MNNNLILSNQYLDIFFTEAINAKLIKEFEYTFKGKPERKLSIYSEVEKQKLFQMLLLYENITLLDIPRFNNRIELAAFNALENIEYIRRNSKDFWGENDGEFVKYVKSAMLPQFVESLKEIEIFSKKIDYLKFANNYIQYRLDNINSEHNLIDIGEENVRYLRNIGIEEKEIELAFFQTGICFTKEIEALKLLMKYSSNGGALLNPRFDMSKFSLNEISNIEDQYQIIKVLLSDSIKVLPTFDNLTNVLRFRNKHSSELKTLNSTINEWILVFRDGGNIKLIEKAQQDIKKATKELCYGQTLDKVSQISTYISIPLSIAETFTVGIPISSLPIAFVGVASTLKSNKIRKLNNWVQIIC